MDKAAAIAGSYSDFKLIKSRSVAQVIIELPIERAEAFLKAFGVPQPGAEKPVALALMNTEQPKPERPRKSWGELSFAHRSGILRNDPRFIEWLGVNTPDEAADIIRRKCGVESCARIDGNDPAQTKFTILDMDYRYATGQQAEPR